VAVAGAQALLAAHSREVQVVQVVVEYLRVCQLPPVAQVLQDKVLQVEEVL
jgi:hypothetical protein